MHFERKFRELENIEEISVYDMNDTSLFRKILEKEPVEELPFQNIITNMPSDLDVFKPVENGNDFLVIRLGWSVLQRGNAKLMDVEGRLLSELSPVFYEIFKDTLKKVYDTHEKEKLRIYYYIKDRLTGISNITIIYESGKICLISDHKPNNFGAGGDSKNIDQESKANLIESLSQTGSYYKTRGTYSWSPGIYNIINRPKEENDEYYNIVFDLVIPEDKPVVDKIIKIMDTGTSNYEAVLRIKTPDGVLRYLETSLYGKFDENGELISRYGLFKDVTRDTNKQITRPVDYLLNGFKNNKKLALLIEPLSHGIYEFSEGFYNIVEKTPDEYHHSIKIIENIEDEETVENLKKLYNGEIDEVDETFTFRVNGDENNKKICELYVERFDFGSETHSIGFMTDISEEKQKQDTLIRANNRMNVLIKEIHHRVKNNLQLLNSFLNLEKRAYKDSPDLIIDHMQTRLASLALLHEKTYDTQDFTHINLADYIHEQDNNMLSLIGNRDIKFTSIIDPNLTLTIEVITPLLLIIDELTMNALKHAFTEDMDDKEIYKEIKQINNEQCELIIKDNGVGLGVIDETTGTHLGWQIIRSLTGQLDGEIEVLELERGSGFRLIFASKIINSEIYG